MRENEIAAASPQGSRCAYVRTGGGLEPYALSFELDRPCGPNPSANPTASRSPFPRKGPFSVSFCSFGVRDIRIPTAAKPQIVSLLPWEGGGAEGDGG